MPETLDDILFEHRNREYGSYWLRKRYAVRLAVSFLISISLVLVLILSYFWYLNAAGDETVYLYPYAGSHLKSTEGKFMDPMELKAFLDKSSPPAEQLTDPSEQKQVDALQDFRVVEEVTADSFKPAPEETGPVTDDGMNTGLSNDSTVFGGFLLGTGEGMGSGSDLDRFPVFPGGLEAVRRFVELTVKYPPQAVRQKIHGVVLISFDVNKQGEVDNIKVERSIDPLIDVEAIKAIQNMPRWKPGMRHGKPVIVKFIIPVNFMPLS